MSGSAEALIGSTVASYRVLALIGRGGQGVVYRAEHVTLGREVALKVLAPELASDESFRQRFLREARTASRLDHPNILDVFDAGQDGDLLFLAERLVVGTDLGALIRSGGPMSLDRAIELLDPVAEALDAAHRTGLVHRDVKPGNVLVEPATESHGERVYLSDFGLVKAVATGAQVTAEGKLTQSGFFVGTPDYSSPEQIRGGEVDGRSDEYSFACMLYECLTGEVPFPSDSAVESILAHVNTPPPALSTRRQDLPPRLTDVIKRALAKWPTQRYATCGELMTAVRATAAEPPTVPPTTPMEQVRGPSPPARPPTGRPSSPEATDSPPAPRTAPAVVSEPTTASEGGLDRRDDGRGRRTAVVVAVLAGVLLVGVVTAVLLAGSGSRSAGGPSLAPSPPDSTSPHPRTSPSVAKTTPTPSQPTCTATPRPGFLAMRSFKYDPTTAFFVGCTNVSLLNEDSVTHTFTIVNTTIDVTLTARGSAEVLVALPPGRYVYYCRFHGSPEGTGMAGKLTVLSHFPTLGS